MLPDLQQSALPAAPYYGLKHALCSSHGSKAPCACFQFFPELLGRKALVIRQASLLSRWCLQNLVTNLR